MKRKIFSKLLMGAFLIASVSSFVSCKDYDDDINNLQKQIDAAALKADLNALQTNLAAQIAAAQSAAERAQAAAEAAAATANNAATKDALEAVKTIASNAGTQAAQAIADAANAKAAADAAQATANNAGTAAEKAAADAAKAIADAAAAQNTANVAQTAAAAAQEAAKVAQTVADGANSKAADALKDAASALTGAAAAQETAKAAQTAASSADATAKEAKATAETALASASNAAAQAAEALKSAAAAEKAAEAAKYNDEAVKLLIAQAQASADAAAQDAKDAAEAAAAAVLASASATEDAAAAKAAAAKIDEAIAEATKAISEAGDAKIKAAIAEVEAKIPADQSEAVKALQGELKNLADTQAKLATAESLSTAVEELEGKLDAAVEEAAAAATVAAVAAAAGTFEAAFNELYSGVTSVELVASFSGWAEDDLVSFPLGFTSSPYIDLNFIFGKMKWTATFGDEETESGISETYGKMEGFDADELIPYKEGDDIRAKRALLVRVNPTNATFTKDQVKFVNSKLETLDEIVEIGDPYRYDGMITRGQESGLWVIPVKVVDGTTFNKFNETVFYKGKDVEWNAKTDYLTSGDHKGDLNIGPNASGTYNWEQKLYAVAINNTTDPEDAETPRYVTSTFDIATVYEHYTPATSINAYFEWTNIKNEPDGAWISSVHNRWWSDVSDADWDNGEPAGSAGIWSIDQKEAYTLKNPEKRWNVFGTGDDRWKAGLVTPTSAETTPHPLTAKVWSSDWYNTTNDGGDMRRNQPMIDIADVGEVITVELPTTLQKKFEYWYITYDFEANAVESSPSEWEAWKSYKDGISGLYEMTAAAKPIKLRINKETAFEDVIGFRIWAVNYDGSLGDPDGRAFYVKVGDSTNKPSKTAKAQFKAVSIANNLSAIANLNAKNYTAEDGFNVSAVTDLADFGFESLALSKNQGKTTVAKTDGKNSAAVDVYWKLLDSKGNLATNWKDIKKLVVGVDGADLNKIVDNATLDVITISDKRGDANNREVYSLKIQAQKVLPDDEWVKKNYYDGKFTWHSDYDPVTNVMTIYPKPYVEKGGVQVLYPVDLDPAADKVDFYWRGNGGTGAWNLWDIYDDPTYLDWTGSAPTLANAGLRQIQDYNYKPKDDAAAGLDMSLYFFEFKGLPTGLKNPATETYKTYWSAAAAKPKFGNNTFVAVKPEVIRTDKQASLYYTFTKVSTTYDSKTKTYTIKDHTPAVWNFTASFKDALDLVENRTGYAYMAYTEWVKNDLGAIMKKGTKYLNDNTLYIAWKNGTGGGTDFSLISDPTISNTLELYSIAQTDCTYPGGINPETGWGWADEKEAQAFNPALYKEDLKNVGTASDDITKLVYAYITESNDVLATGINMAGTWSGAGLNYGAYSYFTAPFDPAYYSFDNPATDKVVENAPTFELTGEIATYLKIDQKTAKATALKAFKVGGISDPKRNIPGTLKMTGYDVFGKQHVIEIPVAIVFNF
ncbi:MAG: hypothetical protein J5502_07050 [Prevotella sp.]|nr:hypothetical protein [Prevotella sp.]